MSIEPIGAIGPAEVNPAQKSTPKSGDVAEVQKETNKEPVANKPESTLTSNEMSTENFLVLKTQNGEQDPFANLDDAIERIQTNIEEMGKALESLVEKIQKVSEMSVGLQLLTKTFEAIDRYRQGPGGE
jgi:hypothetical protein